jgi:ElaB/YqjD/DUF883 family membrane-anchored ribosome-binding protein
MDQPTSKVANLITGDVDALRAEVARLSQQLGIYVREEKSLLARLLSSQAKDAKRALDDRLSDASIIAGDYSNAAGKHAARLQNSALGYVNRKPLQSLAIVAGVGLVLGFLSRGRS